MKKNITLQKVFTKFEYILINRRKLTLVFGLIILALSAVTRFLPPVTPDTSMVFDESYFVPQVESYPVKRYYFDPHPPLGKFFLYLGMMAVNPDAANKIDAAKLGNLVNSYKSNLDLTGIRLAPKVFGSLVPVLIMGISLELIWWRKKQIGSQAYVTGSLIGLTVGLMAALDNSLIIESRFALLTQIMLFFMLLTVYFALKYVNAQKVSKTELYFILTTVAFGAAVSVKWLSLAVAVVVVLGILYKEFSDKYQFKWPWKTLVSVLIQRVLFMVLGIAMIYGSIFAWHFAQMQNYSPAADELSEKHIQDLKAGTQEVGLTSKILEWHRIAGNYSKGVPALDYTKKDEIGSMWLTWPVMARPMNYYWQTDGDGMYGQIYLIGNPVVWAASLLGVFSLIALGFSRIFSKNGFRFKHFVLIAFFAANWLPFALITRVMYLYHYVPAMVIGIIMLGVFMHDFILPSFSKLGDLPKIGKYLNNSNLKLILFCLVILSIAFGFFFYSPLTYAQKQTREHWQQRVLLKEWNMKWPSD